MSRDDAHSTVESSDRQDGPAAKDFKVVVVGGGIIGLACAIGLGRAGIEVEVFEATLEYGSVGGAVGLGPNALRALKELGILGVVQARAEQPKPAARRFRFLSGMEGHEVIYDCPVGEEDGGLSIQRATFMDVLASLAAGLSASRPNLRVHMNKRCEKLRTIPASGDNQTERVEVGFTDGTCVSADLVLGVDGVRSVVRSYVLDAPVDENAAGRRGDGLGAGPGPGRGGAHPQAGLAGTAFMNSMAFRAAVPYAVLVKEGVKTDMRGRPHCWIGPDQHIVTFPLRGGEMIHAVAFVNDRSSPISARPPPAPPTSADLSSSFASWGPDARALVKCMEQNASAWPLYGVWPPLPRYVKGRVALLGDAAHAMLPHLGAGIGQGLEDVVVLLNLLVHPKSTSANIETILSAYDLYRRPHANAVLEASAGAADIFQMHGPSGSTEEGVKTDVSRLFDVVWRYDVKADCGSASAWLREQGVF